MIHKPESFAALIEQQMKDLKINQVELERRSQITDTAWANWRAGGLPSKSLIGIVADTLQVDRDRLREFIAEQKAARRKGIRVDTVQQAKAWCDQHATEPTQAERA